MRIPNWPELLVEYLDRRKDERFQWGVMDCCTFACDWVEEITGVDPMAELRHKYSGPITAQKAMIRFTESGDGLAACAQKLAFKYGFNEVKPSEAQRGDVVLIDFGSALALGIVGPDHHLHGAGPQGIVTVPLEAALRAWRI